MKINSYLFFIVITTILIGCSKKDSPEPGKGGTEKTYVYESLVFSTIKYEEENQYFSTFDTSFKHPKSRYQMNSSQLANVDIVYFYDTNYSEYGFMDPYTASQRWYWDEEHYLYPWLSVSKKTIFYSTKMKQEDFEKVKIDHRLFDQYFKDTVIAPHNIFPPGSCIGGRTYNELAKGQVWALKAAATNKRSFLFIRNDQENGWPDFAVTGFRTKVDIVREK